MICSYRDCKRNAYARNLCRPHSTHLYRYGEARKLSCDPNEILWFGTHAEIVMYTRDLKEEPRRVLVDICDIPTMLGKRFYISHGYGKVSSSKTQYIHRMISPCAAPLVCDHINQNKLDCRRSNLHCVTRAENMKNMYTSLKDHRWKKKKG